MTESLKAEPSKWHHPSEVMKLHKLKQKKKKLQARIAGNASNEPSKSSSALDEVFSGGKRKNPFLKANSTKKTKPEPPILDESTDQTLFKLLNQNNSQESPSNLSVTSFDNILNKLNIKPKEVVEIVKAKGKNWLPIDWTLKSRVRLLSEKPFHWNQKLKISEEASGITAFTRCLDNNTDTTLDTSPNAKFHQCCLYWQQPCLPWLTLFPRHSSKSLPSVMVMNAQIKDSLQQAYSDGMRSLFQLIRIRQCPYFYACANNFTVLFRSAGIGGFTDVHALICPTTRGFRESLRQEEIEFTMPLKNKRNSDQGYDTWDSQETENGDVAGEDDEDDPVEEGWLKSLGVNEKDIKQINYAQDRLTQKQECEIDNSERSLVLVEGVEVLGLHNFLINCKSAVSITGHLAGIPPTLLAPVAFKGASLNSLKVRQAKVHLDDSDYYSLELSGPILPSTMHNLFAVSSPEHSLTATFTDVSVTEHFSKLQNNERRSDIQNKGTVVFGKENLSDCGLLPKVLKHFCNPDREYVTHVECLKYDCETKTYTWT
ncbi:unnamed protein product [Acanthoscelides obtectus]|uniref:Protein downstream neighbor of son homolog n=1 Tax=Acanthoscelides obtectus TaxID=200917 RepID=A0A9P0LCZ6_ACAOB|nr:unnamed protein product [Acanthoscelides obtectus]CAK1636123.1 Protein downstream neighbor of son homolog [Acanthoscelides obtectus]